MPARKAKSRSAKKAKPTTRIVEPSKRSVSIVGIALLLMCSLLTASMAGIAWLLTQPCLDTVATTLLAEANTIYPENLVSTQEWTRKLPGSSLVAFSPNGKFIVTAGSGEEYSNVRILQSEGGRIIQTLPSNIPGINSIQFSPSGNEIVSAGEARLVSAWLTDSCERYNLVPSLQLSSNVNGLAFSSDGSQLALAMSDGSVAIWDADSGEHLQDIRAEGEAVYALAYHPDGSILAITTVDGHKGVVEVWRVSDGALLHTLEEHSGTVNAVMFSPDGAWLVSAGRGINNSVLRVWDPVSGELLHSISGHVGSFQAATFSPNGGLLAASGPGKLIQLWRTDNWTQLKGIEHEWSVNHFVFSPDGQFIVSATFDGSVSLWALEYLSE